MNIRDALAAGTIALTLSGCATWVNPQYQTDANAARHFKIDKGRCKMAAAGSRPFPIPSTPPSSQTTTYQGQTYDWAGKNTGSYSGTSRTANSNAFGNGVASGFSTSSSIMAAGAQRDIYEGCLMNLGWHKK